MDEELSRDILKGSAYTLNGPYKFYAEIDNRLCYSISRQLGTYDNPEIEVYMECPIEEGFATLQVMIPTMDIIQRSNVSDSLFKQAMQFIQSYALDMVEVAEGGSICH